MGSWAGTISGVTIPSLAFDEGILVWDVKIRRTPDSWVFFERAAYGTHRNFYAGGKLRLSCRQHEGLKGNIFVGVDISDPNRPREVSRWWVRGQWEEGGRRRIDFINFMVRRMW